MVRNCGRNKTGSIEDLLLIGMILVFFSVALLISFRITAGVNEHVSLDPKMPATAKTAASQMAGYFPGVLDNVFLFLTFILAIGAIILAALVRIHPIFIPLFLVAQIFITFLCAVFSNIYQSMASSPELITQATLMPKMSFIMQYLPVTIFIIGIILMVVQYKTWSTAQ